MAVIECNMMSKSLMRNMSFYVVLPTDKAKFFDGRDYDGRDFKTLYLLHGYTGDHTDWLYKSRVIKYAMDKDICVVMPSGDNKFYVDNPETGEYYSSFIVKDLVEFCEKTFPLSKKREDRFIGGLSMGGYGAIVNAFLYTDKFSAVVALSSGLILSRIAGFSPDDTDPKGKKTIYGSVFGDLRQVEGSDYDYFHLARTRKTLDKKEQPRFYLACGRDDFLFEANVEYKDELIKLGYDVTWVEDEGAHDWDFWDKYIKKSIDYLMK